MKDKDYIYQINNLLNELENNIDLISFESTYHSIIVISQKICGLTLEFQLKNEDPHIFKNDFQHITPMQMIRISGKTNMIPGNQIENLYKIRIINNKVIHGMQPTYQEVFSLLNRFSGYITWFDSSYLDKYYLKPQLKTESLILKINSLLKPKRNEIKKENRVKSMHMSDLNKIYKTEDYKLTKQEEENYINQINKLLIDYENQLTSVFPEKNYYFALVGQNIIELMLKLLIKKEGYYISENYYMFSKMIRFSYENQIIPLECYKFLNLINRYRNEFAHEPITPNNLIISFLNAFSYFIQWYDNYYSQLNNSKSQFKIENCCKLIYKLKYEKSNSINKNNIVDIISHESNSKKQVKQPKIFKLDFSPKFDEKIVRAESSKDNEINKLKLEIQRKEELLKKEQIEKEKLQKNEQTLKKKLAKKDEEIENNKLNNLKIKLILKYLDENSKSFAKCMDILNEHIASTERIETKIDNIDKKIDYITNQISTIQSFTERQVKNANSKEEIEKILENFMDECIDNIMSNTPKIMENNDYEREKIKLIRSMGESAWMKLSEKSKSFLITSKVMYNHLIMIDDIIDYSGICVLVTKA
ncbi:hypothetical protein [uncultured Methanobrevibacter sp.]|uniref:hypothetical protein n=1 Tax=uncultured Methanobrevibacter sp. TaxID=253161 RepID=UPI0025DD838B|nr:hypothetical protein [uncultured Methanobrevibacter sp.]